MNTPRSSKGMSEQNRLVIVEAKHHITRDKIERNLEQLKRISQFLEWARAPPEGALPKFKKSVEAYGFDKYSTQVHLYIGGVYWENDAVDFIQELLRTDVKNSGVVWPSGMRYDVFDASNMFNKQKEQAPTRVVQA